MDERIVATKRRSSLLRQTFESFCARPASGHATMSRRSKRYVLAISPQPSRLAVVVVTTRDYKTMDRLDESGGDWQVPGHLGDPLVCPERGEGLFLRPRHQFLVRFCCQRHFELVTQELRSFDL